jgi:hypothetical protein
MKVEYTIRGHLAVKRTAFLVTLDGEIESNKLTLSSLRVDADKEGNMKKTALVVLGFVLCSMVAVAAPTDNSWDGWISDAKCAAKGANAAHAQCAKKCVEGGEKPVLVTDKDQKVVPIDNPSAVAGHEGQHVKVTGSMNGSGSLHIDKVTPLS